MTAVQQATASGATTYRRRRPERTLLYRTVQASCGECRHGFLIAFSGKGRGVCPSCNTRRMVETAVHLAEQVIPRLPVRQWVLAVPKRLRYFLHRDPATSKVRRCACSCAR